MKHIHMPKVDPGWVATKMGGPGAPGDLAKGAITQAWLAVSDDPPPMSPANISTTRRQKQPDPTPITPICGAG